MVFLPNIKEFIRKMDYTYDYVLMFFRAERAWGQDILNEIYGSDLDEMIDCQWAKSRAV